MRSTAPDHPLTPPDAGRAATLDRLQSERFDLLVVGGGIVGAAVAARGSELGLDVALVDRGDFACGTSSASSKLIHGGLRYLRMGDVRLVREGLRESEALAGFVAPHLVQPPPLPAAGLRRRPVRTGGGARRRSACTASCRVRGPPTRSCRVTSPLRSFRRLRLDGLREAAVYSDAQTNDARLCLANVRAAADRGAAVANYAEVVSIEGGSSVGEGRRRRPDLRRAARDRSAHRRQCRGPVGRRDQTAGRRLGRNVRDPQQGRAPRRRGPAGLACGRHDSDRRLARVLRGSLGGDALARDDRRAVRRATPTTSGSRRRTKRRSSRRPAGGSTPRSSVGTGSSRGSRVCACSLPPAGAPRPRGGRRRSCASGAAWSPWPAGS